MSNCEKCSKNMIQRSLSCESFLAQLATDQGIRSKILLCPKFTQSRVLDYVLHDQIGGAL